MSETEKKHIYVERSAEAASARAAELFREITRKAIKDRHAAHVALAGGTTPRSAYLHLANQAIADDVDWARVHVFFGDERDVPHDHIESNYGMAQRTLLDHMPVDWSNVHPMRADADDLDQAAAEYERDLRAEVPDGPDGIPQLDLLMLGMGGDGHTASLFPGSECLEEGSRLVVCCHIPMIGRNRMTFTYPLINNSRNILFLVTGDDKADVVRRVFAQEDQSLPAARVYPIHGTMHVVFDEAAARLL